MAWTTATERRRRGGEAVEAGGGAAQSYSANQVALDPISHLLPVPVGASVSLCAALALLLFLSGHEYE